MSLSVFASASHANAVFTENFETDLDAWNGKNGGGHSGEIVGDPLRSGNKVLRFNQLDSAGHLFSDPATDLGEDHSTSPHMVTFEFLANSERVLSGDPTAISGGCIGWSVGLNVFPAAWKQCSPGAGSLLMPDNGQWNTCQFNLPTTQRFVRIMLEEFVWSNDGVGDAFFDNIQIVEGHDTEGCNLIDPEDPDTDGDGVPDDQDICEGFDDNSDTDVDGVPDGCDPCPLDPFNDSDGDGVCDSDDLCLGDDVSGDDDSDGLCNDSDTCFGASNSDADGDGVCDEGDLCFGNDASGNDDGDGVCNDLDLCVGDDATGDTDGDSFCDDFDACPVDVENDADGDGVCEDTDNCPTDANPSQADFDRDGAGDACDADDDNDGVDDVNDNCRLDANTDQADFDGDGAGDECDADDDNDGVQDDVDACETAIGDLVNENGCSIANLCPCDNNWKNHGAYVRCVAHTANDFVELGLISDTEHDDIVSAAGQSSCGAKQ